MKLLRRTELIAATKCGQHSWFCDSNHNSLKRTKRNHESETLVIFIVPRVGNSIRAKAHYVPHSEEFLLRLFVYSIYLSHVVDERDLF